MPQRRKQKLTFDNVERKSCLVHHPHTHTRKKIPTDPSPTFQNLENFVFAFVSAITTAHSLTTPLLPTNVLVYVAFLALTNYPRRAPVSNQEFSDCTIGIVGIQSTQQLVPNGNDPAALRIYKLFVLQILLTKRYSSIDRSNTTWENVPSSQSPNSDQPTLIFTSILLNN